MRLSPLLLCGLVACSGVHRSRWQTSTPALEQYTVCQCDGTERQPTPSEAASFRDGERVDVYCEGKVYGCHIGSVWPPLSRRYKGGFEPRLQD